MSVNINPRVSPPQSQRSEGELMCPYCQTSFPLTWRRYLLSLLGNHRCPQCRQVSYLKDNSPWLWPIRIVGIIIYSILVINVSTYLFDAVGVVRTVVSVRLFLSLIIVLVGFPIDKWMEGHLRQLRIRS
jgi:hypothetical protein